MQEALRNPKQMQCTVPSYLTCLNHKILRTAPTVAETKIVKFYAAVLSVLRTDSFLSRSPTSLPACSSSMISKVFIRKKERNKSCRENWTHSFLVSLTAFRIIAQCGEDVSKFLCCIYISRLLRQQEFGCGSQDGWTEWNEGFWFHYLLLLDKMGFMWCRFTLHIPAQTASLISQKGHVRTALRIVHSETACRDNWHSPASVNWNIWDV
jgi:hypothetical protein